MSGASSSSSGGKTYDTTLSDAYAKAGAPASQVQAIRNQEISYQSGKSGGNAAPVSKVTTGFNAFSPVGSKATNTDNTGAQTGGKGSTKITSGGYDSNTPYTQNKSWVGYENPNIKWDAARRAVYNLDSGEIYSEGKDFKIGADGHAYWADSKKPGEDTVQQSDTQQQALEQIQTMLAEEDEEKIDPEEILKQLPEAEPVSRISWDDAQTRASSQLTPLYEQTEKEALEAVDRSNLSRGFYGQLPGDAFRATTAADIGSKKAAAIAGLANDIVSQDEASAENKESMAFQQRNSEANLLLNSLEQSQNQRQSKLANAFNLLNMMVASDNTKADNELQQKKFDQDKADSDRNYDLDKLKSDRDYEVDLINARKAKGGSSGGTTNNDLYTATLNSMLAGQSRHRNAIVSGEKRNPHSYNSYISDAINLGKQQGTQLSAKDVNALMEKAKALSAEDDAWTKSRNKSSQSNLLTALNQMK